VSTAHRTIKERDIAKFRHQAYFEAEVEAGAIYPRRFAVVDEIVVGVMYLLENSMMNDYDVSHTTHQSTDPVLCE
jgi:hypothetical protein